MSNIREVARLAGVSVATVSRTLKSPERVLAPTRERVMAAVEQAGYRPNLMAVQFRSRRTGNLVILVPTIANTFLPGSSAARSKRRRRPVIACCCATPRAGKNWSDNSPSWFTLIRPTG